MEEFTLREKYGLKKREVNFVAGLYADIDDGKAARLESCSDFLGFGERENSDGYKLIRSSFCRVRLCPMCQWRRSVKLVTQLGLLLNVLKEDGCLDYLFLTLTQRNCELLELSRGIDELSKAFNRFRGYKDLKKVVRGWFKALEVTYNRLTNTWHPHFHVLLAVPKSYFHSRDYLSQAKFVELWRRALGVDYDPVVDVRRVKGDLEKVLLEVAKYTVKDAGLFNADIEHSKQLLCVLDKALHKRRFVAYGGVFKELHSRLNLTDPDEPEADGVISVEHLHCFSWNRQHQKYIRC